MDVQPAGYPDFGVTGKNKGIPLEKADIKKTKSRDEEKSSQAESSDIVEIRERVSAENHLASVQVPEDEQKAEIVLHEVKNAILKDGQLGKQAQSNVNIESIMNLLS